jgi:enoyl-CoA hydratase/carnithine racemase
MSNETAPRPHVTAVTLRIEGAIGRLTLARPEKLNALNRATLEELAVAAAWFDAHPAVKVVVVSGQGRAFSAGFDLGDASWSELGPPEASALVGRSMAEAIGAMNAITLASIRGHCVGGAVVLASACDLRIASTNAQFRIPEVDLGVPLLWTGVPRLVRELGPALTKELVLTGRSFDAEEARSIRFVNRVVDDSELESQSDALASVLAAKPALVLHTTKRQVEEASPSVPASDGGGSADRSALAGAFADAECREVASRYAERRRTSR